MSYLKFDKNQLINLEYALGKEILRSNRAGSYASSSIIGCNTRKYHGLLVSPVNSFGGAPHVLLSSLDVTVIQHGKDFRIGLHKYQGDHFEPRGHKYIRDFEADIIPRVTIRVGGVILTEERLLVQNRDQILIKYTLVDAHSKTLLRFKPFLAFRNAHSLTKANLNTNTKVQIIENGVKSKLYEGFPDLNMQFNKSADFIQGPQWHYNIEYIREMERGYDYKEDLFVPGYFEVPVNKGESIVFSASTTPIVPSGLKRTFSGELKKRVPRNSFKNCLVNSAQQFIKRLDGKTEVIAGFPWFGSWGRDTFISLPGLTLTLGDISTFKAVMRTELSKMNDEGLFPNVGSEGDYAFNSVDAPLWFIWDVQQYVKTTHDRSGAWKSYGKAILKILEAYKEGTSFGIRMAENGLIYSGVSGKALTWMDAIVNGEPVTPRVGYDVEINSLWYNAILFMLDLSKEGNMGKKTSSFESLPEKIQHSFVNLFWSPEKKYLADFATENYKDWSVRPNQVFATSLPYSPLTDEMKKGVLDIVKKELHTSRGLRTLSPKNVYYKGVYFGNQEKRDRAYHQGTVWPWLLGHFCEGYLKIHKSSSVGKIRKWLYSLEDEMSNYGIGSIAEIYDGDPPHKSRGAISQAWSVAEILRAMSLLEEFEINEKRKTQK